MSSYPAGYVDALLHEREGYKAAKRWDRMRQVDVELAKFGVAVDDAPVELAVEAAPEKRRPGRPRKNP